MSFYRLLWSGFGKLVLVMEHDPWLQEWILFMSSVNHGFGGGLVRSFQGNERMWKRESYMKSVEEKEGNFLASGENLSSYFSAS